MSSIEADPITEIFGEEISDSRGNPTIKVTVRAGDHSGSFSVPSGASTGKREAKELRDEDGKGVKKALAYVNGKIREALIGRSVFAQNEIDQVLLELDGTRDKSELGGNALIGVSIALAKAGAHAKGQEVWEYLRTLAEIKPSRSWPFLYMNLINGGKHAANGLAFQEYHVVPQTEDPEEAMEMGINIQKNLKILIERELGERSVVVGDEGGFAPEVTDVKKPLEYLREAIKECGYEVRVRLALDVAGSSFFQNGKYKTGSEEIPPPELLQIYLSLADEFRLLSIEDPFNEEDFEGFRNLKISVPGLLVVGDDLTVTNPEDLSRALQEESVNAMIIKPNQIGTLSQTLSTMKLARENGVELIVSHRSGETDDDFIADLAFAFGCFGLKAGAPSKPERMVKYKRLINIKRSLLK